MELRKMPREILCEIIAKQNAEEYLNMDECFSAREKLKKRIEQLAFQQIKDFFQLDNIFYNNIAEIELTGKSEEIDLVMYMKNIPSTLRNIIYIRCNKSSLINFNVLGTYYGHVTSDHYRTIREDLRLFYKNIMEFISKVEKNYIQMRETFMNLLNYLDEKEFLDRTYMNY
jgi:hypothetical protein